MGRKGIGQIKNGFSSTSQVERRGPGSGPGPGPGLKPRCVMMCAVGLFPGIEARGVQRLPTSYAERLKIEQTNKGKSLKSIGCLVETETEVEAVN